MTPLLPAALDYAAAGVPVFPCLPHGKMPAIPKAQGGRGVLDATTDARQIRSWWRRWPGANIGLACGPWLWVTDFDSLDAFGFWVDRCSRMRVEFPVTTTVATQAGVHMYWRSDVAPPKNGNPARIAALPGDDLAVYGVRKVPGFDLRTTGGYVLAPPSVHPSGHVYRFLDGLECLAQAPRWLLEALTPPDPPPPLPVVMRSFAPTAGASKAERAAQRILDHFSNEIANAGSGQRDATLGRAALAIGGLVKSGWLNHREARAALVTAGRIMQARSKADWTRRDEEKIDRALRNATAWSPTEARENSGGKRA